jgi:hypothetical protein
MIERLEAALELFVAHQKLAEAIEPAMRNLDDPSSGPFARMAPNLSGLLAAAFDMGNVSMGLDRLSRGDANVTRIGAQVFVAALWGVLVA